MNSSLRNSAAGTSSIGASIANKKSVSYAKNVAPGYDGSRGSGSNAAASPTTKPAAAAAPSGGGLRLSDINSKKTAAPINNIHEYLRMKAEWEYKPKKDEPEV